MDKRDLGQLIEQARLRRGMTQKDLASCLGVQASYVSLIETGARRWPQEYVGALARALGLSQYEMAVAAGLIEYESREAPPAPADPRLAQLVARLAATPDARKAWEAIWLVLDAFDRVAG